MELYPTEEESVLVLLERVSEAQRIAAMEIRESNTRKGFKPKGGRSKKRKR